MRQPFSTLNNASSELDSLEAFQLQLAALEIEPQSEPLSI